jgi:UPF0176 protein
MRPHNTLSATQRAQLIDAAGQPRVTISFYKYYHQEDPQTFRDHLFLAWEKLGVLGRIYIAHEGINAQLSVPADSMQSWKKQLESIPFLAGIRLNIAVEQYDKSFLKLTIKVRKKIVADGIEDPTFDATLIGTHLKAEAFNRMLGKPNTLLVDMRNHFESEIGHFEGAIKPDVDTFRESLDIIESELKEHKEDKQLLVYCTGGIRCEKASAYFKHKGFKQVFQLEGGIIEYFRQVKSEGLENKFKGKNFVFDERLAERISEDIVSTCHLCNAPSDTHHNCDNEACHILFIHCSACAEKFKGCCSEKCQAIRALPDGTRKALRQGTGAPKKYFKRPK